MLKAFYEVIPREKIRKIQIDFALGNGIYGELVGDIPVDEAADFSESTYGET